MVMGMHQPTTDIRVEFKFQQAELRLPKRSIRLPPVGKGWYVFYTSTSTHVIKLVNLTPGLQNCRYGRPDRITTRITTTLITITCAYVSYISGQLNNPDQVLCMFIQRSRHGSYILYTKVLIFYFHSPRKHRLGCQLGNKPKLQNTNAKYLAHAIMRTMCCMYVFQL